MNVPLYCVLSAEHSCKIFSIGYSRRTVQHRHTVLLSDYFLQLNVLNVHLKFVGFYCMLFVPTVGMFYGSCVMTL